MEVRAASGAEAVHKSVQAVNFFAPPDVKANDHAKKETFLVSEVMAEVLKEPERQHTVPYARQRTTYKSEDQARTDFYA